MSHKDYFRSLKATVVKDTALRGGRNNGSEVVLILVNLTGSRVVALRSDKSIRVWRCGADKLFDPLLIEQPHGRPVEALSWHPKHEFTFATVGRDNMIKIWKINSSGVSCERTIYVKDQRDLCQVSYSADGERMVAVDLTGTVQVYSTKDYVVVGGIFKMSDSVCSVRWANQGRVLIFGLKNGMIEVYGERNGENGVETVIENSGGNGEEKDREIYMEIDSSPGLYLIQLLKGHRSGVTSLAIDPLGKFIVAGLNEGVVSIWGTKDLIVHRVLTSVDELVSRVDVSKDGQYLAVAFDGPVNARIYDTSTFEQVTEVENSGNGVNVPGSIVWFPNKVGYMHVSDNGKTMTYVRR